jgi:hypothetical protein
MHSSSERLVVFVTPAQKRVLAARAARMGISLSELVRRAVLAFDDTGEEVRAAGLVDRLGATHSRLADSDTLRRLAAGEGHRGSTGSTADSGHCGHTGSPAGPNAQAASRAAVIPIDEPAACEDETAALPVAAAVARALAAQAHEAPCAREDGEEEAAVARVIANESGDLSRF